MNLNTYLLQTYKNGFFVDVGANDGIKDNKTLILENNNWSGICIEGLKLNYDKLIKNRKCICCYEVVDFCDNREIDFVEQTSDIYSNTFGGSFILNYDNNEEGYKDYQQELDSALNFLTSKLGGKKVKRITKSLNTILKEQNCPNIIHYLKLDIERLEYQVMKTFDFNLYTPYFILAEGQVGYMDNNKLVTLLLNNNYHIANNDSQNILFQHNSIYQNGIII